MKIIEEIQKLKALLDQGAINNYEFNLLKKKVLSERIDTKESQKSMPLTSTSKTIPVQEETKNSSFDEVHKPIIKDKKSEEYESATILTEILSPSVLLIALGLSIVLWVRYDNFWIFLIFLAVSYFFPIRISRVTPKVSKRNLYLSLLIVFYGILILVPIDYPFSKSSPSSEQSSETPVNNADKEVRDFIISNNFKDIENGVAFTLEFSDSHGGWNGIMTFSMGSCYALYAYEVKGRRISLTFDSSNCTNHGSSTTATINSNNTISLFYQGESFVFKPY